jgi:hypothetical protein
VLIGDALQWLRPSDPPAASPPNPHPPPAFGVPQPTVRARATRKA